MATSSNFETSNKYITYNIELIGNSTNVANNTSNVTVKVSCWRTNTGYTTWGNGTCYCKIDGTTYSSGISNDQSITSSSRVLFTKTLDIGHNSDGTKSVYVSAWINHDRFSSSEQGFTVTLTTIPRTSGISAPTDVVEAGGAVTVTIHKNASAFRHWAYYVFGNTTITVAQNVDSSFNFNPPLSLLNQIPNATTGVGTMYVDTYTNGSSSKTKIGTVSKLFRINAPASIVPSISSVSFSRDNSGYPSAWTENVANVSRITASFSASGKYGSSISSYSVSGTGINASSNGNSISFTPTSSGYPITVKCTVTDSRGRSASVNKELYIYWYEPPKISSFTAYRCTSSGTANEDGTYLKCTATFSYDKVNSKNSIVESVFETKLANVSSDSWTKRKEGISSNTSYVIGGGKISADNAWIVRCRVNDTYTSSVYEIKIPTGSTIMDFRVMGKGLSIGGVCTTDGFNVDWPSYFNQKARFNESIDFKKAIDIANSEADSHDSIYINFWRGNSGLRGAAFSSDNNGSGMRLHLYDDSGTWKAHYAFQPDGVLYTPGLDIGGSQALIGKGGDNSSWIGFHDTVRRRGWVGKGSRADNTISLTAETGDLHLRVDGDKVIYFLIGGDDYRLAGVSGRRFGVAPVVSPRDGVMEIGKYVDFHTSSGDTGDYSFRLQSNDGTLSTTGSISQGSDINLKKDIMYVDDMIQAQNAMLLDNDFDKSNISTNKSFKDFLVNDFKFATFKYKRSETSQFGFIAQDIEKNDLSSFILREVEDYDKNTGETTKYWNYDLSAFTSVVARALQEEIIERDKQIEKLEKRIEALESIIKGE